LASVASQAVSKRSIWLLEVSARSSPSSQHCTCFFDLPQAEICFDLADLHGIFPLANYALLSTSGPMGAPGHHHFLIRAAASDKDRLFIGAKPYHSKNIRLDYVDRGEAELRGGPSDNLKALVERHRLRR
jgi:hypothetical protein